MRLRMVVTASCVAAVMVGCAGRTGDPVPSDSQRTSLAEQSAPEGERDTSSAGVVLGTAVEIVAEDLPSPWSMVLGLAVDGEDRLVVYSTGFDGNRVDRSVMLGEP
ncbi:hypothetical protein Jden_1586 [Jonesia denitrificans DSM 20603]|uniref:Glucose dehydrogenase n=2 Tax=Jonesia TaxID=43673 RepID=C7R5G1_JONDD|nr:hypothetical protein Jden_1586 [Jonesia denitrificans DSM 20603]SQH21470.1 Uncharacterised protein [Jonesia denitrificans]